MWQNGCSTILLNVRVVLFKTIMTVNINATKNVLNVSVGNEY